MDDRIAHLRCRYRPIADRDAVPALIARLDRVARDELPRALDGALARTLGTDAVYVLRRVDSRLTLRIDTDATDGRLARRWADGLAAAVARTVAASPGSGVAGSGVARFADQAEYVARFVRDLLAGRAGSCWYYGPLERYRNQGKAAALHAVLLAHREHLPRILAQLPVAVVETLLAVLEPPALRSLWCEGLSGTAAASPAAGRPLVAAALDLADRLGLWAGSRPASEALLRDYQVSAPPPVDWRDRRGLAAGVLDVLRFLLRRGARSAAAIAAGGTEAAPSAALRGDAAGRRARVLAELDWLDSSWLDAALGEMAEAPQPLFDRRGDGQRRETTPGAQELRRAAGEEPPAGEQDFTAGEEPACNRLSRPAAPGEEKSVRERAAAARGEPACNRLPRPAANGEKTLELPPRRAARTGPTPRQLRLLEDLAAVLTGGEARWDLEHPDSAANALRLYARLVARTAAWGEDPLATGMIRQLLSAAAALHRSAAPAEALSHLASGELDAALRTLPQARRSPAAGGLSTLARLGEPAVRVAGLLLGLPEEALPAPSSPEPESRHPGARERPEEGIESPCAGLFLLLRTIADLRLPAAFADAGFRDVVSLAPLAALGLRWAGEVGLAGDRLDPGLALFAGLGEAPRLGELRACWAGTEPPDHARFLAVLLRTLAGQRLVDGSAMRLHRFPGQGAGDLLIAGDAGRDLWPLGAVLGPEDDPAVVIAGWLAVWEDATGRRPGTGTCDHDLEAAARSVGFPLLPAAETDDQSAHREARERLTAALGSVAAGHLGSPEADLTLDLTAAAVLRAWARWLPRFDTASVPYLLTNFIRRGGRIVTAAGGLRVELDPAPLDVVLRMADYLAELERPGSEPVRFEIRGT